MRHPVCLAERMPRYVAPASDRQRGHYVITYCGRPVVMANIVTGEQYCSRCALAYLRLIVRRPAWLRS